MFLYRSCSCRKDVESKYSKASKKPSEGPGIDVRSVWPELSTTVKRKVTFVGLKVSKLRSFSSVDRSVEVRIETLPLFSTTVFGFCPLLEHEKKKTEAMTNAVNFISMIGNK